MTLNKRVQLREINEPIFHITISQIRVKSNSTQANLVNPQGPLQPFHAHPKYNNWIVSFDLWSTVVPRPTLSLSSQKT